MTAEIQVLNFVKTALRAPVTTTDTQLQLTSGTGSLFNPITAGNFVFVTVNDSTTAEIMKYTSSGDVVNDTITVERAQDNTTAKAFPVGSCVAIGWNVEQIEDLITQQQASPVNTQTIEGPVNFPTGVPPTGILYTVNLTTGQLWYYAGSGAWLNINSNSVQIMTVAPTLAPDGSVIWTVNTTNSGLYFWDGVGPWRLVSGGGTGSFYQVYARQYLDGTGVALAKGFDYPVGGTSGTSLVFNSIITFPAQCLYKSNPAISNKVILTGTNTMQYTANSVVQLTASMLGDKNNADDFRGQLSIFHAGSLFEWQNEIFVPANTGNTSVSMTVGTTPFQVVANDEFDLVLTIIDGGGSYGGMVLNQLSFAATVTALI